MIRPLRILVVQNVPHTLRGGMSRMLGFIHDRVADDGHEIEYFSAEQVPQRWRGRRGRLAFPWLALRHTDRAAKEGRPYDVVNIHEPSAWAVACLKRYVGKPAVVVTTHGIEERGWEVARQDARLGRDQLGLRTRLVFPPSMLWASGVALRRADHIFCLNEDDRQYLLTRYRRRPERVTRMYPAAAPAYLAAFAERDYSRPPTRLLWFGTWLVRKGTPDIVVAFKELADRFPELKMVVMGAGLPEEVVRAAFPQRLWGRVEYVPAAPGAETAEYATQMLASAAYVLPSVFEGTPLALMETMATGLPPVASAVCGMKDVIRDGENGLLVSPRNPAALVEAIGRLLTDRELRERLGRRAHADVVARYTWDKVAEPVRGVYQQIAEARHRRNR